MSGLFEVDSNGVFKIIATSLRKNISLSLENKFLVSVEAFNSQELNFKIRIIVQLSKFVDKNRCPKISNKAMCQFSINQSDFDPSF